MANGEMCWPADIGLGLYVVVKVVYVINISIFCSFLLTIIKQKNVIVQKSHLVQLRLIITMASSCGVTAVLIIRIIFDFTRWV